MRPEANQTKTTQKKTSAVKERRICDRSGDLVGMWDPWKTEPTDFGLVGLD